MFLQKGLRKISSFFWYNFHFKNYVQNLSNLALKSDFPTDLRMDLHGVPTLDSGNLGIEMTIKVEMATIFIL